MLHSALFNLKCCEVPYCGALFFRMPDPDAFRVDGLRKNGTRIAYDVSVMTSVVAIMHLTPAQFLYLIKCSYKAWRKDYASSMGAAIAFYTVFSIAPLLIIVIAVAGFIWGEDAVRGE